MKDCRNTILSPQTDTKKLVSSFDPINPVSLLDNQSCQYSNLYLYPKCSQRPLPKHIRYLVSSHLFWSAVRNSFPDPDTYDCVTWNFFRHTLQCFCVAVCSSVCSGSAPFVFFTARTCPKATGMWKGGSRPGGKSLQYSCLSQRMVRGRRHQGAVWSMWAKTRRWKSNWRSREVRRVTCVRRREVCGCCQAHSNCGNDKREEIMGNWCGREGFEANMRGLLWEVWRMPYPQGSHIRGKAMDNQHHIPIRRDKGH